MADNEHRVLKSNTFDEWRQSTNEVSFDVGDDALLDNTRLNDKVFSYTASAGQIQFTGNDSNSDSLVIQKLPDATIDNTAGYIILKHGVTPHSDFQNGATVSQGSNYSATIESVVTLDNKTRILVKNSTGTFSASADLAVGSQTIANANIERIVSESFPKGNVRVKKAGTELVQGLTEAGFHIANHKGTVALTGTPSVDEVTEGITIYQASANQTTQEGVESNASWWATVYHANTSSIKTKNNNGTFSASSDIRVLGYAPGDFKVDAVNVSSLSLNDDSVLHTVELNNEAASGNAVLVITTDLVSAVNELQDDIGTVENLSTSAGDLVLAINEHEGDIGNMTLTGLSATDLSAAARELRTELGDVTTINNATGYSATDASAGILEIQGDIGDVTSLTTSHKATLVGAIGEIESVFDASTKEISAGSSAFNITSGTFTVNSSSNINLDTGNNHIVLKSDGTEFGRLTHNGGQLQLKSGANQVFLTGNNTDATFNNDLTIERDLDVDRNLNVDGLGVIDGTLSVGDLATLASLTVTGATQLNGGLTMDTNKFTVANGTGNTLIAGTLNVDGAVDIDSTLDVLNGATLRSTLALTGNFDINTNKFNVVASSGNTTVAGTLGVTGNVTVGSLTTSSQHVKGAINELQSEIGSAVFSGDITDGAASVTAAIGLIEAEIGDDEAYESGTITYGANTISGVLVNLNAELDALNGLILTAGAGLSGGGNLNSNRSFAVNVDDSSIEINSDSLRVKSLGITNAMLAGSINQSKLAGSIPNSKLSNSTITILAESGTAHAIALGESLTVSAGTGINTNIDNNTLEISAELATASNAGVATFDSTDFTVSGGGVSLNDERIEDIVGAMVSSNTEDGISVTYADNGTGAGKLNFDIDDATVMRLTTSGGQTFNQNINFTSGNTLTIPNGSTLDVSSGTLLLPGTASGVSTFGSAFLRTEDNSAAQQGFAVKNKDVHSGYSHDPKIQWNHSQVASNPRRAWQAVGLAADGTSSETADLVTFENARDLITSNIEAGINVTWDDTNNNFDFNVNDPTLTFTGDATGSGTITNLGNTSIALTIPADAVENSMIANDSITIGNSTIALGGTDTTLTGLTDIDLTSGSKTIFDGVGANTLTLGASNTTIEIAGNLTVSGTTTTINTTNLDIEDATLRIAKNAGSLSATNGAGLEFGASSSKPTLLWNNSSSRLEVNKRLYSSVGFTGSLTGNADTSSKWSSARTVNFNHSSTDVSGSFSIQGDTNVSNVNLQIGANKVTANELDISGNGTSGQVVVTDGDGSFSYASKDNYGHWILQADSGSNDNITSTEVVDFQGGNAISTTANATGVSIAVTNNSIGVDELNVSEGSNGEVLTTNGSGGLSFTAVSTADTFVNGGSLSGGTLTLTRSEGASNITVSGFVQSSDIPTVNNGQIDGRTSGLGLSGSMDATANQSSNTAFTVTSNATISPTANTIAYRGAGGGLRATNFAATGSEGAILFDGDPGDNFNDHDPVPLKRIVCNDGGGNFNIRSGSYYSTGDKYAAGGGGAADIIFTSDSAAGEITLRTAPAGTNAGDAITYANELELSNGFFKLKDGSTTVFQVDLDAGTDAHHVVADGNITAEAFVKSGGTSSQFLKADGSVDSSSYVTSSGVTSVTGTSPIASSGGTTPAISINLDLLPDMTQTWVNGTDEFIVLDNGVQKKKLSSEIFGSNAFNSTAIPAAAADGLLDINAGSAIDLTITGGDFTANKSSETDITINVDLSEVADMTQAWTSADEFIVLDNSVGTAGNRQKRKIASEIPVGFFNNDDGSGNTAYNNYEHPTFTARSVSIDTTGAEVLDTLTLTSNNIGSITAASATKRTLTAANLGLGNVDDGAEVNQNAFAKIQSQNGGTNSTLHDSDAKRDTFTINAGAGLTITDGTDAITIDNDITQVYNRVRALNSSGNTLFTETANSTTGILKLKEGNGISIVDGGDDIFQFVNAHSAGEGLELGSNAFSLKHDQRLAYSSGDHVKIGHSGATGSSYLDFNVQTASGDSGYIDVYTSASSSAPELNFRFANNGDFHADSDIYAFSTTTTSDVKLKDNIQKVEGALELVSQLDGVTFNWKKDGKASAGVIAQNVEKVLPSAVKEVESLDGEEVNKHVDYNQLSALFIEAIKELREENKLLKAEIESLKHINKGIE